MSASISLPEQENKGFLRKDKHGQAYYSIHDALNVLGISRRTFEMRKRELGIMAWKPRNERKFYYRVDDILLMKQEDDEFLPVGKIS